jgi:hypothetical protein
MKSTVPRTDPMTATTHREESRAEYHHIEYRHSPPAESGSVDRDGHTPVNVKARLVDIEPDPAQLRAHLPVELTTWLVGTDADSTDAVTFGFQQKKEGCP